MNSLIKFWQELYTTKGKGCYIHPQDKDILDKHEDLFFYGKDEGNYNKDTDSYKLHVDLLPSPFMGDLVNAKVYLYMLNPGFDGQDYADHSQNRFWEGLSATIKQDFSENEHLEQYKFFLLHPEFRNTAGGCYFVSYLKKCIDDYQAKTNKTYEDALKVFANNVCFVQALPYHSQKFNGKLDAITKKLTSHQVAKEFVMSLSNDPQKLVFIVRGYRYFVQNASSKSTYIPFTKRCEYGVRYFPYNQEWNAIKHGDRLVNHLIKLT